MRNLGYIASAVSILFLLAGFKLSAEDNATLSAKELEVMEYVVRFSYGDGRYPTGIIDFLTTTAMPKNPSEWKWEDLPTNSIGVFQIFLFGFARLPKHIWMEGSAFARRAPTSTDICTG